MIPSSLSCVFKGNKPFKISVLFSTLYTGILQLPFSGGAT